MYPEKNKKEEGSHDEGFPHEQRGLGTRLNKGKQFLFPAGYLEPSIDQRALWFS